jgi:hypothetical protein
VYDQVEAMTLEQLLKRNPVANIQLNVLKVPRDSLQSLEVPGRVAGLTKKEATHIVIHPDDLITLPVEMFNGFGPDQTAAAGYQNILHPRKG